MKYKVGDIVKINSSSIDLIKCYNDYKHGYKHNDDFYVQPFVISLIIDNNNRIYTCIPTKYETNIKIYVYEHDIIPDLPEMRKNKLKRIFNEI